MNTLRNISFALILMSGLLIPTLGRAQHIHSDQFESVTLVPRLSGALHLEASVEPRFQLTQKSLPMPTIGLGFGTGYSFFFDPHGQERLRLALDLHFAGLDDELMFGIGSSATYSIRKFSKNFAHASFGLSALGRYLQYEDQLGYEAGIGFELNIGSIFYDQPYLFGELSNLFLVSYNSLNGSFGVLGSVGIRFDWAFRDRTQINEKWE